jgi:hypothetical protein
MVLDEKELQFFLIPHPVPLPHYTLGLLMMGYKWARNMYRRSNEIKGKNSA